MQNIYPVLTSDSVRLSVSSVKFSISGAFLCQKGLLPPHTWLLRSARFQVLCTRVDPASYFSFMFRKIFSIANEPGCTAGKVSGPILMLLPSYKLQSSRPKPPVREFNIISINCSYFQSPVNCNLLDQSKNFIPAEICSLSIITNITNFCWWSSIITTVNTLKAHFCIDICKPTLCRKPHRRAKHRVALTRVCHKKLMGQ